MSISLQIECHFQWPQNKLNERYARLLGRKIKGRATYMKNSKQNLNEAEAIAVVQCLPRMHKVLRSISGVTIKDLNVKKKKMASFHCP